MYLLIGNIWIFSLYNNFKPSEKKNVKYLV